MANIDIAVDDIDVVVDDTNDSDVGEDRVTLIMPVPMVMPIRPC